MTVPADTRPYFYLELQNGGGRWTAERVLPLQGGHNFRDLGGYRTSDDRTVRWGRLYRSGSMAGLTERDYQYLGKLGIRFICDLRSTRERQSRPNEWVRAAKLDYWTRDYEESGGELARLSMRELTPAKARMLMAEVYRTLPYEQAAGYREMFRQLATGNLPLAFNCTGGKDRAGIAAALILTSLNVPMETIVADYELTNRARMAATVGDDEVYDFLKDIPPETLAAFAATDPAYLAAAFDEMTKRNGSPQGYLREVLGVTADIEAKLKALLLE